MKKCKNCNNCNNCGACKMAQQKRKFEKFTQPLSYEQGFVKRFVDIQGNLR